MFWRKLLMSMAPPAARPMVSPSGRYLGAASCAPEDFGAVDGSIPSAGGVGAVDGAGAPALSSIAGADGAGADAGAAHADITATTSSNGIKININLLKLDDCDFFILYSPFIRFLNKYTDEKIRYYKNDSKLPP